ncbi:MAG: hypothetical protein ACKESB_03925 [Candidatus Hodgkinia cicadicola]
MRSSASANWEKRKVWTVLCVRKRGVKEKRNSSCSLYVDVCQGTKIEFLKDIAAPRETRCKFSSSFLD